MAQQKVDVFVNDGRVVFAKISVKRFELGAVFLEVNPVGQFGMVSLPCNYQLEKRIAQYLIAS